MKISNASVRRSGALLVLLALSTLVAAAGLRGATAQLPRPRMVVPAIAASNAVSVPHVADDTSGPREALRKQMIAFFRTWRGVWLQGKTQLRRPPVKLSKADQGAFVELDLLRASLYVSCPVDFAIGSSLRGKGGAGLPDQGIAYRFQSSEFAVPRQLRSPQGSGSGTICVDWMPADQHWEDESANIDLAVAYVSRAKVRNARTVLLRYISAASRANPNDPWITGQFVRFLIDQRQLDSAAGVASRCRGDVGFCTALFGLAEYRRDHLMEAERAFRVVDSMRYAETWTGDACDAPELAMLRDRLSREIRALPCATRAQYIQRLWWLSDPLWSDSGNLRYVEHHARKVDIELHRVTPEDERFTWGQVCGGLAARELVMRYGWPSHVWFDSSYKYLPYQSLVAQACPDMPNMAREYMISRVPLVPDWEAILDPFSASSSNWLLERPEGIAPQQWWPVEHMPLAHALRGMPDGQLAYFRRDTMVQLALAIDGPTAPLRPNMANFARSVLVASTGPSDRVVLDEREALHDETLLWAAPVSGAPMLLSAELMGRIPEEPDQRLRFGTRPPAPLARMSPGDIAISDPALLTASVGDGARALGFEAVLATLRGSTRVSRGEALTVYWESYGVALTDTVDVTVELMQRDGAGGLRRLGAALGVGDAGRDSVSVRWREPASAHPVTRVPGQFIVLGRTVSLQPGATDPGEYVLAVQMQRVGGAPVRGQRAITILPEAKR
jgi:hypothetical protein